MPALRKISGQRKKKRKGKEIEFKEERKEGTTGS